MSTIGPDASLNRAGLESLDGRASLDGLQPREQGLQTPESLDHRQAPTAAPARQDAVDAGEAMLNAVAWGDTPAGQRLLPGDAGFEGRLGAMDLSLAADSAADAVLAAIG